MIYSMDNIDSEMFVVLLLWYLLQVSAARVLHKLIQICAVTDELVVFYFFMIYSSLFLFVHKTGHTTD